MSSTFESRRLLLNWRPRFTVRARLTATVAVIVTTVSVVMVAAIYSFMRFVPTYSMPSSSASHIGPEVTKGSGMQPEIAATISTRDDVLETLLAASLISCVVIAVLGSVVGWVVSGRVLRPLSRITDAARQASHGALDYRVGLEGPDDEFFELASTFDEMLDRLERAMHSHRRFAANASHELKTPLATTKAMLDVAATDPGHCAGPELIRKLSETNQRSIDTVEALLDLSDVDNADFQPAAVDIAGLIDRTVEELGVLAREHRLSVTWDSAHYVVYGEPTLLARLINNLIENAVRHNVDDGFLVVRLVAVSGGVLLSVENSGPLVEEGLLETMGDPFARRVARVRGAGAGHGLGLAMAMSIAHAHEGSISFQARPQGGLVVQAFLPGGRAAL